MNNHTDDKITGADLIRLGYKPGAYFKPALIALKDISATSSSVTEDVACIIQGFIPPPPLKMREPLENPGFTNFLSAYENNTEMMNFAAVCKAMTNIMRVPTVVKGTIMPDACPAGTIPVGGVVATKNAIHPGYHSADVCCSMAITVLKDQHDPKQVLDAIHVLTHFGPTKRVARPVELPHTFVDEMSLNPFLAGLESVAINHFTTQGDGNHFYYVGHLESTGELVIVSHHGSRGFGAQIYKRGMAAAQRETRKIAPDVPKSHAWLNMNTDLGLHYWSALSAARAWTKLNHFEMHNAVLRLIGGRMTDRFWNPHNFVFERDGLWYHAKGATPSYAGHSHDDSGRTLIPMNMAEPILITEHTNKNDSMGFAPHGAGRNMSRTQFKRDHTPKHPEGIDARFWCGIPDPSELPAAYKSSDKVIGVIKRHNLASIVDRVMPYGSIMAGDWEENAPWRKK